jgi:hypothetical protein
MVEDESTKIQPAFGTAVHCSAWSGVALICKFVGVAGRESCELTKRVEHAGPPKADTPRLIGAERANMSGDGAVNDGGIGEATLHRGDKGRAGARRSTGDAAEREDSDGNKRMNNAAVLRDKLREDADMLRVSCRVWRRNSDEDKLDAALGVGRSWRLEATVGNLTRDLGREVSLEGLSDAPAFEEGFDH